jgi:hypothetical protein
MCAFAQWVFETLPQCGRATVACSGGGAPASQQLKDLITMAKYAVKFAKGRPVVIDDHGKAVAGAVVHQLHFRDGPVQYVEGRRFGPEHRPMTVDIDVDGVRVPKVPVQTRTAGKDSR